MAMPQIRCAFVSYYMKKDLKHMVINQENTIVYDMKKRFKKKNLKIKIKYGQSKWNMVIFTEDIFGKKTKTKTKKNFKNCPNLMVNFAVTIVRM